MREAANTGDRSLATRITTAPAPRPGGEAPGWGFRDWLAEIADTLAGKALAGLISDHPRLGSLLAGIAQFSPYLWELMRADSARLVRLLQSEPERRFQTIIAETSRAIAATRDEAEVM